ncbi:N-acetyltransferase family protein [Cohnella sp.]|uniref:GNAT family N-acetyltransferase n=1 Tax=Cohnella sp. TaxID=1883426 RepID=UPI0035616108
MNIRILQHSDAESYRQLRLAGLQTNPEAFGSTYEQEAQFTLETMINRITPSKDKFVLGAFAEDGSSLTGIVTFVRESGVKTSHKANVYGMYVAPSARGKGIGRRLLVELIEKAKECDGLEQINLAVVSDNAPAKKLYRALGFDTYGVEKNALKYNDQYYDEDFMVFRLSELGPSFN